MTKNTPSEQPAIPEGMVPCPTCHQYSHSLGSDTLADAFNHFQSMTAHPVRGDPMGHHFDEKTRDFAQVLMSAARLTSAEIVADLEALPVEQPAQASEVELSSLAVRVLQDFRRRNGLTYYVYDDNRKREERHMQEAFDAIVRPTLNPSQERAEAGK